MEHSIGVVTLVPRTCGGRQEWEAWGQQQTPWPLCAEKPGHTKGDAPRRWWGQSVERWVEVECAAGRMAQERMRSLVVHARQLAEPPARAYATAQAKEAEQVAEHLRATSGPAEAVLPRQRPRKKRRASVWWSHRRRWPRQPRGRGGACWRRQAAPQRVLLSGFCAPSRSKTAPWNRACGGSSTLQRSRR